MFIQLFWAGVLLFVANDVVWLLIRPLTVAYWVDFLLRGTMVGTICVVVRARSGPVLDTILSIRPSRGGIVGWILIASATGIVIHQTVWPFVAYRLPYTALVSFPSFIGPLRIIDLTLGVVLVAVSEEVVFRRLAWSALRRVDSGIATQRVMWRPVILSCLLFGLAHWSSGLHAVAIAALWGIIPMVALMRTGSLWPALVAHWATDFIAFLGIMPEAFHAFFKP